MTSAEKVSRAVGRLVITEPLAGLYLASIPIRSSPVRTALTNGQRVLYSADWFDTLTPEEVETVLLHEFLHIGLGHIGRWHGKEAHRWNGACDHCINLMLVGAGRRLVKNMLHNPDYRGKTAEQIYPLLTDSEPGLEDIEEVQEKDRREIIERLGRAHAASKHSPGKVSAGALRSIERILAGRIPWTREIRAFVHEVAGREEFSYRKPAKKHLAQGLYMPSLHSYRAALGVVAIDTSSSIDRETLEEFMAEVGNLADLCDALWVLTNDAAICSEATVRGRAEVLNLQLHGGGGTDFRPVFEKVKTCDFLVFLTDTYGKFPDRPPPYPVMWCTTGGTVPWGKQIVLPEHGGGF